MRTRAAPVLDQKRYIVVDRLNDVRRRRGLPALRR